MQSEDGECDEVRLMRKLLTTDVSYQLLALCLKSESSDETEITVASLVQRFASNNNSNNQDNVYGAVIMT